MTHRRLLNLFTVILLVSLILAGCGAQATSTPAPQPTSTPTATPPAEPTATSTPLPDEQSPAEPTATVAATPVASEKIQLTDAVGRTVELPAPPKRIAVVGQAPYMVMHTLFMFPEARERVVAVEKKGTNVDDFLPIIDPTFFRDNTVLAENAGPEQIAGVKPDLVITKSSTVQRIAPPLEKLGIPVLSLGLETPDQLVKDIGNVGLLFGNEARAQEILDYYQSKLDGIRGALAGLEESAKPRVLTMQYSDRGGQVAVQVPPSGWMQTIQAQTAGANPIWLEAAKGSGWIVVNLEQIALWNPEKVFVIVYFQLDPAEVVAQLKADPQWKALQAVQNDEVYAYPSDIYGWDTPDPRWILGATWLAQRLYPDRFADTDLSQEIYEFFARLYGMDKAAVDSSIMPTLRGDVAPAQGRR